MSLATGIGSKIDARSAQSQSNVTRMMRILNWGGVTSAFPHLNGDVETAADMVAIVWELSQPGSKCYQTGGYDGDTVC